MKLKANNLLLVSAFLFPGIFAFAQTPATQDDEDIQSWNDVQLTVPLTKRFDFITGATGRIGKDISRFNEGRYLIGYVWKPHKAFSVSPFYSYIKARNSSGLFRTEHRVQLRASYKFPIKSFGLTHRSHWVPSIGSMPPTASFARPVLASSMVVIALSIAHRPTTSRCPMRIASVVPTR